MSNTDAIILSAGGKELLLSDFNALKEAQTFSGEPKYMTRPTLENVAKIICAQSGGPHKDIALFELSYFCLGISEICGPDSLIEILLAPEKPSANYFKNLLQNDLVSNDVYADQIGLHLKFSEKPFTVRYGRMATLACLFDFLCAMDQFGFFEHIQESFQKLFDSPKNHKSLQTCTNALGAILRKYRIKTLSYQEADGKFLQVLKFLQEQNETNDVIIRDDDILYFWCLHNSGKDYRGYRTVFDLFCDFSNALENSQSLKAAVHAAPMGLDFEAGEIDISNDDIQDGAISNWESPFAIFDQDDFKDVRFFKKASERKPLENLMDYGPNALAFPVAFLRYDIFGQVQSGITNDLQVGRDISSIKARINGDTNLTYQEYQDQISDIEKHLNNLQAACLYVINPENEMADASELAFQKLNRKGFDDKADPDVFSQAAPALVALSEQISEFFKRLTSHELDKLYETDQSLFSKQFSHLYKEVLS